MCGHNNGTPGHPQFFFHPSVHHHILLPQARRSRGYESRSLEPEYRYVFFGSCEGGVGALLHHWFHHWFHYIQGRLNWIGILGNWRAGLCLGLVIVIMFLEHILKVIFCSGSTHYGADLKQREGETHPPWTGHRFAAEAWEEHAAPPSVEQVMEIFFVEASYNLYHKISHVSRQKNLSGSFNDLYFPLSNKDLTDWVTHNIKLFLPAISLNCILMFMAAFLY